MLLLPLVFACEGDGCLHRELTDWCRHTEDGPTEGPACDLPAFEPRPGTFRCGDYDEAASGPDLSGSTLYFDHQTGELVAVRYWTDVEVYCGATSYWYGERIACERTCAYDPDASDPPPCP